MIEALTKYCNDCKTEKSVTEFHKQKQHKDGLQSWCKECTAKRHKVYSKRYRDSGKAGVTRNKWNNNNREKYNRMLLKSHLKRYYKMTLQQFDTLLLSQNSVCAICHKPEHFKHKHLCIDHDHNTEKVRGLLCHSCNVLLGHAGDSPNILRKAVEYLETHAKYN